MPNPGRLPQGGEASVPTRSAVEGVRKLANIVGKKRQRLEYFERKVNNMN